LFGCRRLHEHTAGILERKLFADDDELQQRWQYELEENLPTGHAMLNLVNQAYQRWLSYYISPLGDSSVQLMAVGVVLLFVTGGLLTHSRYTIEFDAPAAVYTFWALVLVTSIILSWVKWREDYHDRTKQGVYDKSWLDAPTTRGPLAKIVRDANELYSTTARRLGSVERSRDYHSREKAEREYIPNSKCLYDKSDTLMSQAEMRADIRQNVLEALTSAVEELDALPEDMIERLNKIIHDVDDADRNTAQVVAMPSKLSADDKMDTVEEDDMYLARAVAAKSPMPDRPIDAQRTPVSLTSLRKKLGEIPYTTMVRIRNLSTEPLRLKLGVQLESGKYVKELDVTLIASRHNRRAGLIGSKACYHLYPIEEIPARTEVVVVARSGGVNLVPITGIQGQLVFATKDGSWSFNVTFVNHLGGSDRRCETKATRHKVPGASEGTDKNDGGNNRWIMSHETVDQDSNNEVLVTIDQQVASDFAVVRPIQNLESSLDPSPIDCSHQSQERLMQGYLMKQEVVRVARRVFWRRQWCVLSHLKLSVFDSHTSTTPDFEVRTMDVVKIRTIHRNAFQIISTTHSPVTFSARNEEERNDWIQNLSSASGNDVLDGSPSKRGQRRQPNDKQQWTNRTVESEMDLTQPSVTGGATDNGTPPLEIETLPV
jgi:PH domain